MTKSRKYIHWAVLMLSLPAGCYAGVSFIFYAWLNASDPEKWPADKAAVWAYSALGLSIIFFSIFIYCIVKLIKESNLEYSAKK